MPFTQRDNESSAEGSRLRQLSAEDYVRIRERNKLLVRTIEIISVAVGALFVVAMFRYSVWTVLVVGALLLWFVRTRRGRQ